MLFRSQLNSGKDVILEIEIQGALNVKRQRPDTLLLFVTPPDTAELERRLTGRGTETREQIQGRLRRAVEESQGMEKMCIRDRAGGVRGQGRICLLLRFSSANLRSH